MPCLVGCLALGFPRLALFLVWLFSNYLGAAYVTILWPLLGFFFMPLTTLAYAWAWHHNSTQPFQGVGMALILIAALFDFGLLGGGAHSGRKSIVYVQAGRGRTRI